MVILGHGFSHAMEPAVSKVSTRRFKMICLIRHNMVWKQQFVVPSPCNTVCKCHVETNRVARLCRSSLKSLSLSIEAYILSL